MQAYENRNSPAEPIYNHTAFYQISSYFACKDFLGVFLNIKISSSDNGGVTRIDKL